MTPKTLSCANHMPGARLRPRGRDDRREFGRVESLNKRSRWMKRRSREMEALHRQSDARGIINDLI